MRDLNKNEIVSLIKHQLNLEPRTEMAARILELATELNRLFQESRALEDA